MGVNNGSTRCSGGTFLAMGEHRSVHLAEYKNGEREGEKAVWKVFKTGSVYEDSFFQTDIDTVRKAGELIGKFNAACIVSKPIKLNQPSIWQDVAPPHAKCLVEPFINGE